LRLEKEGIKLYPNQPICDGVKDRSIESADFLFLQRQIGLTWGDLSSHISKLEAAGYVEVTKEFLDKKPHTTLQLTNKGRTAFQEYRQSMKQIFNKLPERAHRK
jgi:DNA-binding MarR family transcriptional regulator